MIKFLKNFKKELKKINKLISEPESLEKEFHRKLIELKEQNSQIVWTHYYVPKATEQILIESGKVCSDDNKKIMYLANSLMFKDLADGTLTELYKFKENE